MAITTLAGTAAGIPPLPAVFTKISGPTNTLANYLTSSWSQGGNPVAGTPANGSGGAALSNSSALVAGSIPFTDPASGNSYLARFQCTISAGAGGAIWLCDRLWDCAQNTTPATFDVTSVASQTVNSVAWPARDSAGSTNGAGVYIGLQVTTVLVNAATISATLTYTNSAGTGSRSGVLVNSLSINTPAHACEIFGVQGSDVGVRSIQSFVLGTAATSGNIALFAFRMLAMLEVFNSNFTNVIDALTSGFPRLYNGTVPFFMYSSNSAAGSSVNSSGEFIVAQG